MRDPLLTFEVEVLDLVELGVDEYDLVGVESSCPLVIGGGWIGILVEELVVAVVLDQSVVLGRCDDIQGVVFEDGAFDKELS